MARSDSQATVVEVPVAPPPTATKRVSIPEFGSKLALMATMSSAFEELGVTAEDMVINSAKDSVLVIAPPKGEEPEKVLYISKENKPFLLAAIAVLPQYRARFTEAVVGKVAEGRKSAEYQAALAGIEEARKGLDASISEARLLTRKYAQPFDAALFIDESNLVETTGKRSIGTAGGEKGDGRQRAPATAKWNLERYEYPRIVDGSKYFLVQENAGKWHIESESGMVVAEGTSANAATRVWYLDRGLGENISAPAAWGAAEQERLAAAGTSAQ